ncbi:LCP family glycopolymer transferase [Embleya sp. MST-111070]|uniref:LCP family protein n=1 Tax=Embleya sp. MST-111070 TaxID=3398231 RepID=UPI003F737053
MSDSERAGKQAGSGRDASPETAPESPTEPDISTTPPPNGPVGDADAGNARDAEAAGAEEPGTDAAASGADAVDPDASGAAASGADAGPATPTSGTATGPDTAEPVGESAAAGPVPTPGAEDAAVAAPAAEAGASAKVGERAAAEPGDGTTGNSGESGGGSAAEPGDGTTADGATTEGAVAEVAPDAAGTAADGATTDGATADTAGAAGAPGDATTAEGGDGATPAGTRAAGPSTAPTTTPPPAGSDPLTAAVAAMAADGGKAADRRARRDRRRRVYKRILIGVTVTVALSLVAGSVVVYTLYRKLDGNITSEDLSAKLGPETERPQVAAGAHDAANILLMGSDDRSGDNKQYGDVGEGTKRSDTTILLHLAADRKSSVAVSIPRDLMVDIPSCVRPDGSKSRAYRDQFNHAFEIGGAACTIKTIEQMTKVRVDHHIVIDFSGFKEMVDAVNGVEVCLSRPMRDTAAKLDLPAGKHKLDGEQALGYVRARKNVDDGSDTQRMTRQQRFLAALVKKVKVGDMLTQPWKLYNLLDAGTRSITADPGLSSLKELMDLSDSIKGIPNDKVAFLTVPRQPYRFDTDRDELVQPKADRLFEAIRFDRVAVGAGVSGKDENGFENNGEVRIEQPATPLPSTRTTIDENGERVTVTPTAPGTGATGKGATRSPAGSTPPSTGAPSSTSTADPTSSSGIPSATPTTPADTSPIVTVSGRTAEQDVCAG